MENKQPFLATTMGRIVVTLVSAGVIYGLMLLCANIGGFGLALIVFACCTYFGWKALNFITPNIFLIMPLAGWLIYFTIKGIIAFFIGFIIAPFQIGTMISKSVSKSAVK